MSTIDKRILSQLAKGIAPASWIETAEAANASAVAYKPPIEGERTYITGMLASYSLFAAGSIRLHWGGADKFILRTSASEGTLVNIPFSRPLAADSGVTVSASISSGGGGNTGNVTIYGFTAFSEE